MNDINPQNYQGANATIVGYAGGPAEKPRYIQGDSDVLEVSIGVGEGYKGKDGWVDKGTTWYAYTAAGEWANKLRSIGKGDKIRVDNARQEVREYEKRDGTKAIGISLRFGELTVIESKNAAPAVNESADVWNTPGSYNDETPF